MARSKTGEAIPAERRTVESIAELEGFRDESRAHGDLWEWLRARAVLGYVAGQRVVDLAGQLDVGRSTVNDWLRWYAREGVEGLRSGKPGRSESRLSEAQREELAALVEAGPLAAGQSSAMWTGKALAALVKEQFGVSYHPRHIPRLLHQMGFSVQRPRKLLARADPEAQATWVRERLPALKKKPRTAEA